MSIRLRTGRSWLDARVDTGKLPDQIVQARQQFLDYFAAAKAEGLLAGEDQQARRNREQFQRLVEATNRDGEIASREFLGKPEKFRTFDQDADGTTSADKASRVGGNEPSPGDAES